MPARTTRPVIGTAPALPPHEQQRDRAEPEPTARRDAADEKQHAAPPRAERRRVRRARARWKPLVTIVLLAALATAVTLVLLQSAGVINWGFLGPTS